MPSNSSNLHWEIIGIGLCIIAIVCALFVTLSYTSTSSIGYMKQVVSINCYEDKGINLSKMSEIDKELARAYCAKGFWLGAQAERGEK